MSKCFFFHFFKDSQGQTSVHICATHGHVSKFRSLLDKGAMVNLFDGRGNSPLHLAARNGHEIFILELLNENADPYW